GRPRLPRRDASPGAARPDRAAALTGPAPGAMISASRPLRRAPKGPRRRPPRGWSGRRVLQEVRGGDPVPGEADPVGVAEGVVQRVGGDRVVAALAGRRGG